MAGDKRQHVLRQIEPTQAAVVHRLFTMVTEGLGLMRMAKRLNAEQVPPPRGGSWAPSCIRELLSNPLYKGLVVWNKTQTIDSSRQMV
jgi:hypothetical protein